MSTCFLIPAYGREYDSTEKMMKDWKNGKDFRIYDGEIGPYCSIRDSDALKLRYSLIYMVPKIGAVLQP